MKRKYLLIALLFMVMFSTKVSAQVVGDCKVLVTFKQESGLDDDKFICKDKGYGNETDDIYYSGKGNVIKLNNFKAYYFTNNDMEDVILDISGVNTFSLLNIDSGKLSVLGNGSLKFKENSFVTKLIKGKSVYHYSYKKNVIVDANKNIYEGTLENFIDSYEELKEYNKLPKSFSEDEIVMEQVLDFEKMVPVNVTESWIKKNIVTSLSTSVIDGVGIIRYVPKENKLENDKGILISSEQVNDKYKLTVDDLSQDEIGSIVEEKLEDTTLVSFYNISVYNGKKEVSMKNGKYTIKIKVDDNIHDYENLKIIYVNDKTEIEEYLDAHLEGGYIVFETTHLSNYGIVGNLKTNNIEVTMVPKSNKVEVIVGICVMLVSTSLFLSLILFVGIKSKLFIKKKKRKR